MTATVSTGLPDLVANYLSRVLPPGSVTPSQISITQTGEMFKKPGAHAMRFTATERLAVDRVAFRWDARFPIAPLVRIRVLDGYDDGQGNLEVRALGLPVQRRSDPNIAVGEAYRYLAELPWVPHAMAANGHLEWRALDHRHVEVATRVGDMRPAVTLEFDAAGDIVRSSADARPRDVGRDSVPTPWGGEFGYYKTLAGIRMPTRAEVYWELPEGRFVYWRGRITAARSLAEPYE